MKNLDYFLNLLDNKVNFAVARFNDGELGAITKTMATISRGDQEVTDELSVKLKEAIQHRQENYYVGVPDTKYKKFSEIASGLIGDYQNITSSVIFHDNNWVKAITEIPQRTKKFKNVVWVGSSSHKINNLPFKVTEFVPVNHKNAFNSYSRLKDLTPLRNTIIFHACGSLGRILTKEWFEREPECTILEVGSIFDPYVQNIKRRYQKKYWKDYLAATNK
ncbi:MAG TPA: hypothetical protein VJ916_07420 [Anaerovoracaceae bacterium]|nr:hypothetical protein [Anaerovoracaceae bacterium]